MELARRDAPDSQVGLAAFYWATGGRATLTTRLPVDLPEPALPEPAASEPTATPSTERGGVESVPCAVLPGALVLAASGLGRRLKRTVQS
jgi:hypothetical protein